MENVDSLNLSDDELRQNEQARKSSNPQVFNQDVMSSPTFTNEFRVFARPRPTRTSVATRAIHDQQQDEEPVTVSICGVHENTGHENAKSAYAVWYGENDPRNITRRTKGNSQTKEAGEYQAILETLSQTPDRAKLQVNVTLAHVRSMLTSHLPRNEDNGWIGVPNDEILRELVATLRARRGRTIIGKIHDQAVRLKTKELAKVSLTSENQEERPHLEPPEAFLVTGVRLSQATQSTLYKGILRQKTPPERAASTLNLGITRACVEELTKNSPTNQKIWNSLRSKNFPPKIRAFLWKAMHSAYKVGKYWLHIPSFEQRGLCHACENVEESMEHILTECKASGQEVIWNLAKELWALRGLPWIKPRFGTILGSDGHG